MEGIASPTDVTSPGLGVVMLDGGRYQRRDHFGEVDDEGSHWKEDKVGIVLHMHSVVHECDPDPEFPEWLAQAEMVAEIASLETINEENNLHSEDPFGPPEDAGRARSDWDPLPPKLLHSRECTPTLLVDRLHHEEACEAAFSSVLVSSPTANTRDESVLMP